MINDPQTGRHSTTSTGTPRVLFCFLHKTKKHKRKKQAYLALWAEAIKSACSYQCPHPKYFSCPPPIITTIPSAWLGQSKQASADGSELSTHTAQQLLTSWRREGLNYDCLFWVGILICDTTYQKFYKNLSQCR